MASVALSEAEKVYIVHGVQEDLRVDGRGCDDYRCVEVETDVVSNTSGSARVKLGHTDILVGVKAEMGTPKLEKPNEGYLEFFVDWYVPSSLLCQAPGNAGGGLGIGPAFVLISQAGPHFTRLKKEGACQAIQHTDSPYICIRVDQPEGTVKPVRSSASATPEFEGRGGDDLGTEIANTLYRIFNKSSIDLKSLCVSPREHCWVLYVDVLLLECGGNLFDAISIAVKAALFNTRYNAYAKLIDCTIVKTCLHMHREMDEFMIPRVRVLEDEEGSKDIELSDDPYDCIQLSVENVPCIVTLCKIGCRHVVDATLQEEACSLASLLVSVTSKGVVTCVRKVGKGSLDPESIFEMLERSMLLASLHGSDIKDSIQTGKRVGKVLHASLQSILHKEESLGPKRQKVGFLG